MKSRCDAKDLCVRFELESCDCMDCRDGPFSIQILASKLTLTVFIVPKDQIPSSKRNKRWNNSKSDFLQGLNRCVCLNTWFITKKMTFSLKCTHAHIHYLFPPRAPCSGPKLQLAPFFESYFVCSLATYYNRYSITINTWYEIGITLGVIKLFGNQTPKFGASGAADFFLALLKLFNFAHGSQ